MLEKVLALTGRITMTLFNTTFKLRVEYDNVLGENGRIFLQVTYDAPCTHTSELLNWHGRKWYLSEYMTDDEIIKTSYAAFEAAVKHEIMEGFKVDGKILFNPHVSYTELLAITDNEVKREQLKCDWILKIYFTADEDEKPEELIISDKTKDDALICAGELIEHFYSDAYNWSCDKKN